MEQKKKKRKTMQLSLIIICICLLAIIPLIYLIQNQDDPGTNDIAKIEEEVESEIEERSLDELPSITEVTDFEEYTETELGNILYKSNNSDVWLYYSSLTPDMQREFEKACPYFTDTSVIQYYDKDTKSNAGEPMSVKEYAKMTYDEVMNEKDGIYKDTYEKELVEIQKIQDSEEYKNTTSTPDKLKMITSVMTNIEHLSECRGLLPAGVSNFKGGFGHSFKAEYGSFNNFKEVCQTSYNDLLDDRGYFFLLFATQEEMGCPVIETINDIKSANIKANEKKGGFYKINFSLDSKTYRIEEGTGANKTQRANHIGIQSVANNLEDNNTGVNKTYKLQLDVNSWQSKWNKTRRARAGGGGDTAFQPIGTIMCLPMYYVTPDNYVPDLSGSSATSSLGRFNFNIWTGETAYDASLYDAANMFDTVGFSEDQRNFSAAEWQAHKNYPTYPRWDNPKKALKLTFSDNLFINPYIIDEIDNEGVFKTAYDYWGLNLDTKQFDFRRIPSGPNYDLIFVQCNLDMNSSAGKNRTLAMAYLLNYCYWYHDKFGGNETQLRDAVAKVAEDDDTITTTNPEGVGDWIIENGWNKSSGGNNLGDAVIGGATRSIFMGRTYDELRIKNVNENNINDESEDESNYAYLSGIFSSGTATQVKTALGGRYRYIPYIDFYTPGYITKVMFRNFGTSAGTIIDTNNNIYGSYKDGEGFHCTLNDNGIRKKLIFNGTDVDNLTTLYDLASYTYYHGNKSAKAGTKHASYSLLNIYNSNKAPVLGIGHAEGAPAYKDGTTEFTDESYNRLFYAGPTSIVNAPTDQSGNPLVSSVGYYEYVKTAEDDQETVGQKLKSILLANNCTVTDIEDSTLFAVKTNETYKNMDTPGGKTIFNDDAVTGVPNLNDYELSVDIQSNEKIHVIDIIESDDLNAVQYGGRADINSVLNKKAGENLNKTYCALLGVQDNAGLESNLITIKFKLCKGLQYHLTVVHSYGEHRDVIEDRYIDNGVVVDKVYEPYKESDLQQAALTDDVESYTFEKLTVNEAVSSTSSYGPITMDQDYTLIFYYVAKEKPKAKDVTYHTGHKFTESELQAICPTNEPPRAHSSCSYSDSERFTYTVPLNKRLPKDSTYTITRINTYTHSCPMSCNSCRHCKGHTVSDGNGGYNTEYRNDNCCNCPCTLQKTVIKTQIVNITIVNCEPSFSVKSIDRTERDVIKWSDIVDMVTDYPKDHEDTNIHTNSGATCSTCSGEKQTNYTESVWKTDYKSNTNIKKTETDGTYTYTVTFPGTGNDKEATFVVDVGHLELDHHNPGATYPIKYTLTDGDGDSVSADAEIVIDWVTPDVEVNPKALSSDTATNPLVYHTNETIPQGDFFCSDVFSKVYDVMDTDAIEGDKPTYLKHNTTNSDRFDISSDLVTGGDTILDANGLPEYVRIISTKVDETLYVQRSKDKDSALKQEATLYGALPNPTPDVCTFDYRSGDKRVDDGSVPHAGSKRDGEESASAENWRASNTVVEKKICTVLIRISNPRNPDYCVDKEVKVIIVNDAPDIEAAKGKTTQLLVLYEEWTEDAIIDWWSSKAWDLEDGVIWGSDSHNTLYGVHDFTSLDSLQQHKRGIEKYDQKDCLITTNKQLTTSTGHAYKLINDGNIFFYRFKITDWGGKEFVKNGHSYFDTTEEGIFKIEITFTDLDNATASTDLYIQVRKTEAQMDPYIRYINKYFLGQSPDNGGFEYNSKWRTNATLKNELKETLDKKTEDINSSNSQVVYYFSREDIKKAKENHEK